MFTGIVEELGTVTAIDDQGDAIRLTVESPTVLADAGLGDSIAVNGCCLTVTEHDGLTWTADVMRQTLDLTSLAVVGVGDVVNLERAVTADKRLGGHIVQGHVDGVGTVLERTPSEHWEVVRISLPSGLARYLVDQGSITVDGVSLKIAGGEIDQQFVDAADRAAQQAGVTGTPTVTLDGKPLEGSSIGAMVDTLERALAS